MRKDQLPEENAESERTLNNRSSQTPMDYTPLVILQQRLNSLENFYSVQYPNDDDNFVPRIARVAPMSARAEPARSGLPSINYQPVATVDISALQLANPTAATFSNAAAAHSAVHAAVHITPHSASYTTASSNTATYASPPVSYTTTQPSLYCIASTSNALSRNSHYGRPASTSNAASRNTDYYGGPASRNTDYGGPASRNTDYGGSASRNTDYGGSASASNSDTESATSTETVSARDLDYDMIPTFRRRALDDYDDENMAEHAVPRKMAKRSVQHVTAVDGGGGGGGGNDDDHNMDCGQ